MIGVDECIIFNTVDNGIVILDEDLTIIAWNRWLEIFTKVSAKDIIGKNICDFFTYIDKKKLIRKIKSVLLTEHPSYYSVDPHRFLIDIPVNNIINKSYNSMQQNVTIVPYNIKKRQVCIYIYDITALCETNMQLEKLNDELADISHRDPLTNLYNRRYFSDQINKVKTFAKRNGYPLSIILLDIDNFKIINDTYGHIVGDDVIIKVARSLEEELRNSDIVARFGGEEFVILLQNSDSATSFKVAEKIRHRLADLTIKSKLDSFNFTTSFGLAQFNEKLDNDDIKKTIERADIALYQSKNAGKNQTTISQ